jgi:hypothetical protein
LGIVGNLLSSFRPSRRNDSWHPVSLSPDHYQDHILYSSRRAPTIFLITFIVVFNEIRIVEDAAGVRESNAVLVPVQHFFLIVPVAT